MSPPPQPLHSPPSSPSFRRHPVSTCGWHSTRSTVLVHNRYKSPITHTQNKPLVLRPLLHGPLPRCCPRSCERENRNTSLMNNKTLKYKEASPAWDFGPLLQLTSESAPARKTSRGCASAPRPRAPPPSHPLLPAPLCTGEHTLQPALDRGRRNAGAAAAPPSRLLPLAGGCYRFSLRKTTRGQKW